MPLNPSAGVGANIKEFHKGPSFAHTAKKFGRGDANRQAVAVALSVARKAKRRADGGSASDDQPQVNIVQPPTSPNYEQANKDLQLNPQEQALYQQHLTNLNGSGGVNNPDGSRSTLYQSVEPHEGRYYNIPTVWDGKRETQPYTKDDGTVMDVANPTALANVAKTGWDKYPSYATPDEADARYDQMHGYMEKDTSDYLKSIGAGMKSGGAIRAALDVARRAKGGRIHVGPIKGNKGGRTDVHEMSVPDGAYVIPADGISHLGENNTDAGLARAQHLFGPGSIHAGRKSGGSVKAVPCVTAGGEFVIAPEVVRSIGKGDIDFGHKILDHFVLMLRKDHIKTLSRLPEPAKD